MVTRSPKNWGDVEAQAAEQRARDQRRRRAKLLVTLRRLANASDVEIAHGDADEALLDYIADDAIRAAFEAVPRWYA